MPWTVGWDVGGAHLKAALVATDAGASARPVVHDVRQWACPLWQGLPHLQAAMAQARSAWPHAFAADTQHAATMSGEMVDLFASRAEGVGRLAAHLAEALGPRLSLFAAGESAAAGPDGDAAPGAGTTHRWLVPAQASRQWQAIASANWLATATWVASRIGNGLLVDMGSTTTDLIALRGGRPVPRGWTDSQRLATGELWYHGVVRTPVCALAPRVPFGGGWVHVMNEFFATTADVYRLLGRLDPVHDQQPTADGADKGLPATRRRLARMIGHDADDAPHDAWQGLAAAWQQLQHEPLAALVNAAAAAAGLPPDAPLVRAGCGDFLVADVTTACGRPGLRFADLAGPGDDPVQSGWLQVAAPAAAIALLHAQEH